jgi:hypothetical protein
VPIPENLRLIHQGEQFLRGKSLALIENDQAMSDHVAMIECAADVINYFAMNPIEGEDEDRHTIRLLGMRLFNGLTSSFGLAVTGYYQISAMVMRDLLETVFLLDYFRIDQSNISEWRTADDKTRKTKFKPVAIRTALDDRDGFKERKRATTYDQLCELASHPTYKGFCMIAPEGMAHHCGPFLDPLTLKATLGELVKLAVQAGTNFPCLFSKETKQHHLAILTFMEISGAWREKYFGSHFDRARIEEMKAILEKWW